MVDRETENPPRDGSIEGWIRENYDSLAQLARRKLIRETAEKHPDLSYEDLCEVFEDYDRNCGRSRSGRWWEPLGSHKCQK
jgi:hypothetical protein